MRRPTFENIYADVPAKQRESLLKFRAMHPYKEFRINAVPGIIVPVVKAAKRFCSCLGGS